MNCNIKKQNIKFRIKKDFFALFVFAFSAILLIIKQKSVQASLLNSLKLCVSTIIPAVFPFMILSDYLICNFSSVKQTKVSVLFNKLFGINPIGIIPFFIGNICGFPLGARLSSQLYENNYIKKDEYRLLTIISSNPSLAFVISGVGAGMRGLIKDGIILYLSVILSTIITGVIHKNKISASVFKPKQKEQSFHFIESVKNATQSSISLCAFISLFSIIINILISFNTPFFLVVIFSSFLEIGSATSIISNSNLPYLATLLITSFTLGFSGLSVYMQINGFSCEKIDTKYFVKVKTTEGILSLAITFIASLLLS